MQAKVIFTLEEEERLIKQYHEYRSARKVSRTVDFDRNLVQKVLDKHNIERYPTCSNKIPIDNNYFKYLTPGSSYFLGV